jgi:hypothetical protein
MQMGLLNGIQTEIGRMPEVRKSATGKVRYAKFGVKMITRLHSLREHLKALRNGIQSLKEGLCFLKIGGMVYHTVRI